MDDYRRSLMALQDIRRRRDLECKSQLSFAQLVSELDAQEGGEALACLVPRKVDPPPGSWQSMPRGATWGSMGYGAPAPKPVATA